MSYPQTPGPVWKDMNELRYAPYLRGRHAVEGVVMGEVDGADPHAPRTISPTQIQADIGDLADFRAFVGQELDLNLRPIVPVINEAHLQGAAWAGHVPSQAVFEARMRYYQAQQASLNNLAQYITAAEVLIETIHRIIATYSDHEQASALDMKGVLEVFTKVAGDRSPASSETRREAHRGGFGGA
jgi:hypothetical protein